MTAIDEEHIRANFGVIWPAHVETFTWFLIQCRRHFHGDLDLLLVLGVIGDRTLARGKAPPDLDYSQFIDKSWQPVEPEPLNARSLAEFTGIPRETARRKVQDLVDMGWVDRDERGYLTASRKAAEELSPLTETTFQYLARMASILAKP
ncbi:MAG: helix-turn-helix domain-containing protein [Hyphomicrobiaceae bacterium]